MYVQYQKDYLINPFLLFQRGADGPTYKFEVRWTLGEEEARCNIPKRPAPGGGSWGTVDGELIAETGRRRGFAAKLYDSFPFERK